MTAPADPGWFDAGPEDLCESGSAAEVVVAGEIVALFRVDHEYRAMQGTCPHHGGPLGKGTLRGCIVTCPWHGWQFDVTDGTYQHSDQLQHPCFPVKVEKGRIWIQMPAPNEGN